mgnify:CR=1 FL=1
MYFDNGGLVTEIREEEPNADGSYDKISIFYDEETGKIKVPELQKSGLSYMNNTVYMEGEGKCNNGIFTFVITFYMYNKETEARWDLQTVTETFLWGMTEYEAMVKNLPIDAYEGYYKVGAYDAMEGTNAFIGDLKVELSVVDDETIAMKGLSAMSNYDDTTYLTYDSETGLLVFTPQFLENKFANYYTFVAMAYNSSTRPHVDAITLSFGEMWRKTRVQSTLTSLVIQKTECSSQRFQTEKIRLPNMQ